MRKSIKCVVYSVVFLLAAATFGSAQSGGYTFTSFDIPGCSRTGPEDINDVGVIVGWCDNGSWQSSHGFIRSSAGAVTMVDYPGALATYVMGVNDLGDVVGVYIPSAGGGYGAYPPVLPFKRSADGTFAALPEYPGTSIRTWPEDINNSGQVVGGYIADPAWVGFLLDGQSFTQVGNDARAINNTGTITGMYGRSGFIWQDGTYTTIFDAPGSNCTFPLAINNVGDTAGYVCTASGYAPFIRAVGGAITTMTISGAGNGIGGIASDGTIVGNFDDLAGSHGFIGTLAPPSDTTPPILTVPAPLTVEATSPAGAVVTFDVTASDPDDAAGPVTCAPSSGSVFPLGTTTVNCSSTDTQGNTGSGSFTVTVQDTTQPFTDGFEGSTLNPFWTPAWQYYSSGGWTLSSEQAHSGSQSVKITSQQFLTHDFGSPQTGSISVWVYSAIGYSGVGGALTITTGRSDDSNPTGDFAILGLGGAPGYPTGIGGGYAYIGGVYHFSSTYGNAPIYPMYPPEDGQWHHFEMTVNTTGLTMKVDGTEYLTNPSFQSFRTLDFGLWGYPNGIVYFDDFSVTLDSAADNTPPTLIVPAPLIIEATSPAGAVVTFDVTASDPDDSAGPVTCAPSSGSVFALGTTTVNCSSTDTHGNTGSASFTVTVQDTTPPTIASVVPSQGQLWPPNNKMVPISIAVSATDLVTLTPSCQIASVSSNEPGPGQWQTTGPLTLNLLASRNGNGNGRIYTIGVQCSDAAGNSSSRSTTVVVPHDQGKK